MTIFEQHARGRWLYDTDLKTHMYGFSNQRGEGIQCSPTILWVELSLEAKKFVSFILVSQTLAPFWIFNVIERSNVFHTHVPNHITLKM